jgi:hypothetical protein
MEIDDGAGGFCGDGTWQTVEYRQGGFESAEEAAIHMSRAMSEYTGYTINGPSVQKTNSNGWEVHFSGYRRT